jgi:hypothetical protein
MAITRNRAVVFIHGLARKPHPDVLLNIWLTGLAQECPRPDVFPPPNSGILLSAEGVPCFLTYYADVFYGTEYDIDVDSYFEAAAMSEIATERLDHVDEDGLPRPVTPREAEFLRAFERHLASTPALAPDEAAALLAGSEVAGFLPAFARRAIVKKAAMEAYYFLFNKEYRRADGETFHVREVLRQRLLDVLTRAAASAEQIVMISHSMGTLVAYDVLRNCDGCPRVKTLITLGSPLGVAEVQAELKAAGAAHVDFPARVLESWINIYDPLDPICGADPRFADDYRAVDGKTVVDVKESNWGHWRHSLVHYLSGPRFRDHFRNALAA